MYDLLVDLMELTLDQRDLSGKNLKDEYLRPFEDRHLYDYESTYTPK